MISFACFDWNFLKTGSCRDARAALLTGESRAALVRWADFPVLSLTQFLSASHSCWPSRAIASYWFIDLLPTSRTINHRSRRELLFNDPFTDRAWRSGWLIACGNMLKNYESLVQMSHHSSLLPWEEWTCVGRLLRHWAWTVLKVLRPLRTGTSCLKNCVSSLLRIICMNVFAFMCRNRVGGLNNGRL